MFHPSRRSFLAAGIGGVVSTNALWAADAVPTIGETIDENSTVFLTWQRDPTTTMTVQWVGTLKPGALPKVEYRELPLKFTFTRSGLLSAFSSFSPAPWKSSETTKKPFPKTDYTLFRAELTGLTPDTSYEFRIGSSSRVCRFHTMPAKARDTIPFISGGDCGANSHVVANNIQAARQEPMFAVIGGDIAYENGTSPKAMLEFLKNYSKYMVAKDHRLIPLVPGIGNHEVGGGSGTLRERARFFYALFDGLYPETGYATLDFGDYLSLVLLDTGHTSKIEGDQTEWLEKVLKERRDHPHVMIVNHVPAYPSYRSMTDSKGRPATGAGNRKYWVPLFEKYRVPVVLEHHDHTFKRTKPLLDGKAHGNGVLYLGDGSWGKVRVPKTPEKLDVLAVSSSTYHLSLHRLQGEERFHMALDENGRVMDVSHTGQRKTGLVPTKM